MFILAKTMERHLRTAHVEQQEPSADEDFGAKNDEPADTLFSFGAKTLEPSAVDFDFGANLGESADFNAEDFLSGTDDSLASFVFDNITVDKQVREYDINHIKGIDKASFCETFMNSL